MRVLPGSPPLPVLDVVKPRESLVFPGRQLACLGFVYEHLFVEPDSQRLLVLRLHGPGVLLRLEGSTVVDHSLQPGVLGRWLVPFGNRHAGQKVFARV